MCASISITTHLFQQAVYLVQLLQSSLQLFFCFARRRQLLVQAVDGPLQLHAVDQIWKHMASHVTGFKLLGEEGRERGRGEGFAVTLETYFWGLCRPADW